jgi:hypothetical protein
MAFLLCQESDHLPEAGGGCSGTPYRNIRILIPRVVGHLLVKRYTIPSDFYSQCFTNITLLQFQAESDNPSNRTVEFAASKATARNFFQKIIPGEMSLKAGSPTATEP